MHRGVIRTITCCGLTILLASAEDLQSIVARLEDEDFRQREKATLELAAAADTQLSEVVALIGSPDASPEFASRIPALLRRIFERQCLGTGEPETGAEFQLFFETDGEEFTRVHPVVASLREDSSGAKAGLQAGDVIVSWNGEGISGPDSVIQLRRRLRSTGQGAVVKLVVRRFKKGQVPLLLGNGPEVSIDLTLGPPVAEPTRKERKGQFAGWLDRMRHEHNLPARYARPQS